MKTSGFCLMFYNLGAETSARMHAVGYLTWRLVFSVTFMSHLYYKDLSCESIFHKTEKDLEQKLVENQMPEMRTEDMEQNSLNDLGLHQTPKRNVVLPSGHSSRQKKTIQTCQRHELYVNFTTIGWSNWLVAPVGYNAFYCAGECERPQPDLSFNSYQSIFEVVSATNPIIPTPCCVPTKLSAINVITNLNSKVEKYTWDNMVIDECGCR
ncbi:hypothetical protein CHS0354_017915 [Potamilus streckersoni]|uniref:TGF-beta family profile domain-containing protein n=1 Tax=Potamilus streckersoni TaxID=2493646 RepID=A0AAE0SUL0_9BIVA|nr:hypothetical protein CHS0354_017915 [Potamilus streckersoni]